MSALPEQTSPPVQSSPVDNRRFSTGDENGDEENAPPRASKLRFSYPLHFPPYKPSAEDDDATAADDDDTAMTDVNDDNTAATSSRFAVDDDVTEEDDEVVTADDNPSAMRTPTSTPTRRSHIRSISLPPPSITDLSPLKTPTTIASEYSRRLSGSSQRRSSGSPPTRSSMHSRALTAALTPAAKSTERYSDRYIPSRQTSSLDPTLHERALVDTITHADETANLHSAMLRDQLITDFIQTRHFTTTNFNTAGNSPRTSSHSSNSSSTSVPSAPNTSSSTSSSSSSSSHAAQAAAAAAAIASSSHNRSLSLPLHRTFRYNLTPKQIRADPYQTSPIYTDQSLSQNALKTQRTISKLPFKVLDAPQLRDDFYLNLVDWSSTNIVCVGLGNSVYLWNAVTCRVSKLCELAPNDAVTSVCWSPRGSYVAVGNRSGLLQIWDANKIQRVREMRGHGNSRVGVVTWSAHSGIASASRDRTILIRDTRSSADYTHRLSGHKQEVCGLKWSFDNHQLASGGNDNKLMIWSPAHTLQPIHRFSDHIAAVKAIAWSPHQPGLLASGGGTADRHIRFQSTLTFQSLHSIDTGSQVCNLLFSRTVNEIVSTHGYSLNQIVVWRYPSMNIIQTLTGHTYRVLYLASSPDGQTIVTGAGDETLRFWNVFPPLTSHNAHVGGYARNGIATNIAPPRLQNVVSLIPNNESVR